MPYFNDLAKKFETLHNWLDVRKEQGADMKPVAKEIECFLQEQIKRMEGLQPPDKYDEPNSLRDIKRARAKGPRKLIYNLSNEELYNKMLGALLGRGAGCLLGIPIEGKDKAFIEAWAKKLGQPYPLAEYWKDWPGVHRTHGDEPIENFVLPIDHLGPDDDLVYTTLGLLILEERGINFTSQDVGDMWLKYLPRACTAEHIALENLKKGIKPPKTATKNNPFFEWIGADIRSDPWGYAAPGLPEKAAEYAYRDACVSHVKNGIYGEMFFSAAIATAFVESDMRKILQIAATEIPAKSRMAATVKQTIRWCEVDGDWSKTWDRFSKEYKGMHGVHTLNNVCLTIMALLYGKNDLEKTISYAVMGGYDTDCTGATAGSIVGAIIGAEKLPKKWVGCFNDTHTTYLINQGPYKISDLANRFCNVAGKVRSDFA